MTTIDSRKRLRIRVDPTRCTAFGFCAEFLPEHFTLDEWGYAWLTAPDVDGRAARFAHETARLCPRRAIAVDELAAADRPRGATSHTGRPTDTRNG